MPMVGVLCVPDLDGSPLRLPVENWAHLVEIFEGVGEELPGTPAEVAKALGVSLVELGAVQVVK